ncbi:Protein translocase subunit SecE [bioreactor metagenome]|uniref:Protein translocase subunit SecE n=1 Tax=bioreactor metagenome TaxID=1076179 RepID=A0A645DSI9_9ZZZZ
MAVSDMTNVKKVNAVSLFLREVKVELKKVTWPTKQQLIAYTLVVCITVFMIATLIWVIDSFFSVAFRWLLKG